MRTLRNARVRISCEAHFLVLHGAHDSGTRFLLLTTLKSPFGDKPWLEVAEGGVGVIMMGSATFPQAPL